MNDRRMRVVASGDYLHTMGTETPATMGFGAYDAAAERLRLAAGIDAHITYQVAVQAGDVLTASAVEITRTRRLGVYRVDVARADGTPVSSFTGTVYVTSRAHDARYA